MMALDEKFLQFILRGTWMSEPHFITIHPTDVEMFLKELDQVISFSHLCFNAVWMVLTVLCCLYLWFYFMGIYFLCSDNDNDLMWLGWERVISRLLWMHELNLEFNRKWSEMSLQGEDALSIRTLHVTPEKQNYIYLYIYICYLCQRASIFCLLGFEIYFDFSEIWKVDFGPKNNWFSWVQIQFFLKGFWTCWHFWDFSWTMFFNEKKQIWHMISVIEFSLMQFKNKNTFCY